jgi:peptide/nickel transport system substrate-binding protein
MQLTGLCITSPPDFTNMVPDLAAKMPIISNGNKRITVPIKKGIFYAPFPGYKKREVKPADVKYAFERSFMASVANGYATAYFADIVGAPSEPTTSYKSISGIQVKGQNLIINLKTPTAAYVSAALVMPIGMPVPKNYAQQFDNRATSTYSTHAASSGPYEVSKYDPGQLIVLTHNPNQKPGSDPLRPAYLNKIVFDEGNGVPDNNSVDTLTGKNEICCDLPRTAAQVAREVGQYHSQSQQVPGGATFWIAFNTKIAPFNNVNVRRAVFASIDRVAWRQVGGGPTVGPIAKGIIPPGTPGFNESGGKSGFTAAVAKKLGRKGALDFANSDKGNMKVATKYMLAARKQGVKNINAKGRWVGPPIKAVARTGSNGALNVQGQLEKLGFKEVLTSVSAGALGSKFCGVPKTMISNKFTMCNNLGWGKDFNDPQSMLLPTFDGGQILDVGNVNWSLFNNAKINREMAQAALLTGKKRTLAWARINYDVMSQAPVILSTWAVSRQIASKNVQIFPNGKKAMDAYFGGWSLPLLSIK